MNKEVQVSNNGCECGHSAECHLRELGINSGMCVAIGCGCKTYRLAVGDEGDEKAHALAAARDLGMTSEQTIALIGSCPLCEQDAAAAETVNQIAMVVHAFPAGSVQGWGEIQIILTQYFNQTGD